MDRLAAVARHHEVPLIEDACEGQDCKFHQINDRTLSADTLYTLNGIYYVDPGATLTIPAGTVIQGYYDEVGDVSGAGTIGTLLGRCFTQAFATAKRVRNETGIAEGTVSVSS